MTINTLYYRCYALFVLVLAFNWACAQNSDGTSTYKFNSTLKGGYSLAYKTDDSLQYLYLKKGNKLKLLSVEEKYNRQQLLGVVAADFEDYFVLAHSIHIINPQDPIMFELYKKSDARIVLKGNYIDADLDANVILMYNNDSAMLLYNVITKKAKHFAYPDINISDSRLVNGIRIKSILPHSFVITYRPDIDSNAEREKVYER